MLTCAAMANDLQSYTNSKYSLPFPSIRSSMNFIFKVYSFSTNQHLIIVPKTLRSYLGTAIASLSRVKRSLWKSDVFHCKTYLGILKLPRSILHFLIFSRYLSRKYCQSPNLNCTKVFSIQIASLFITINHASNPVKLQSRVHRLNIHGIYVRHALCSLAYNMAGYFCWPISQNKLVI